MRGSACSSRPSCSAWLMQIRRMQSTALRRSPRPRASNCCCAPTPAATALSTSSKTPQRPAWPVLAFACPLRMWLSPSRTTLLINSSVACIGRFSTPGRRLRLSVLPTTLSRKRQILNFSVRRKDHFVFDIHAVHDADNGGIDRQFLCFGRQAGAGSLNDQHHFSLARTDRIHNDESASGTHQPLALRGIDSERLHGEQFSPRQRRDFLRRHHTTGTLGQEHCPLTLQATLALAGRRSALRWSA